MNVHEDVVMIANIDAVSEKMENISADITDCEHRLHIGYVDIANKFSEIRSRCFDMRTITGKVSELQEEMSVLVDVLDNITEESVK